MRSPRLHLAVLVTLLLAPLLGIAFGMVAGDASQEAAVEATIGPPEAFTADAPNAARHPSTASTPIDLPSATSMFGPSITWTGERTGLARAGPDARASPHQATSQLAIGPPNTATQRPHEHPSTQATAFNADDCRAARLLAGTQIHDLAPPDALTRVRLARHNPT